ncbi:permease [Actinoplanes sp. NPDC051851]|uniref:permease n=1 Tax=Actinoplanes sp. NPDC051851 TaxID=3154753 RepID=UPI00341C6464
MPEATETRPAGLTAAIALCATGIVAGLLGPQLLAGSGGDGALATWTTVFVSIIVQALPFLALGVALSAAVTAFIPASVWQKALPRHPVAAVPVGVAAGALLPGCECASVPVADRLIRQGVTPAAAVAFLLSAPAINPAVIVSTAVAFPGRPGMVLARVAASAVTALIVGWCWTRWTDTAWPSVAARASAEGSRWERFRLTAQHDLFQGGGFLILGAALSATLNVAIPASWVQSAAAVPVLSALLMGLLAVVLCICSEADAFVAASLSTFPPSAQLAFMVVGPAVDLKLIAMQAGTFGRSFVLRTAPLAFVIAILTSLLAGSLVS